jgi:hypothetical protein
MPCAAWRQCADHLGRAVRAPPARCAAAVLPARTLAHAGRRFRRCRPSGRARRPTGRAPAAGAVPWPRRVVRQPLRPGLRLRGARKRLGYRGAALPRLLGRAEPRAARLPFGRLTRRSAGSWRACAPAPRAPDRRSRRVAGRQCAAALGRGGRPQRGASVRRWRICSPIDLAAGGRAIGRGFNRQVYTRMFLRSMVPKALRKLQQHPGPVRWRAAARRARPVRVRQLFTAPLHGFRNTDDYWARASAKPHLHRIRIPALVLNALNDPSCPACLPHASDAGPFVTCGSRATAAMSAFPAGRWPAHVLTMPEQVCTGWRRCFEPRRPHCGTLEPWMRSSRQR